MYYLSTQMVIHYTAVTFRVSTTAKRSYINILLKDIFLRLGEPV